ncbi:MAG TPA: hypothetical protein VMK84_12940 [Streptosporangiaceae bacterium]|nr:hypothetical protein [Streptosporangiaceae bacterium]
MIGGSVVLAYLDRYLVHDSQTGWTVSNISAQVVDVAIPVTTCTRSGTTWPPS